MVDGDGLDVPDALCDWLDEFCEPSSAAPAAMASVADASDGKRAGEAPVTPHEIGVPSDSCVEWVKEAAASLDRMYGSKGRKFSPIPESVMFAPPRAIVAVGSMRVTLMMNWKVNVPEASPSPGTWTRTGTIAGRCD